MRKPRLPKNFKIGTYLPTDGIINRIRVTDAAKALERFFGEYFYGVSTLKNKTRASSTDTVYIAGEYTAYLFRCLFDAIFIGRVIDITISNSDKEFWICFALRTKYRLEDTAKYEKLLDAAKQACFQVSFIGNGIILSAPIMHGSCYLAALSVEGLYEKFVRVFFSPSIEEYFAAAQSDEASTESKNEEDTITQQNE